MSTYFFTNRRRAKDAVMLLVDEKQHDGLTVFVSNSIIYLDFDPAVLQGLLKDQLPTILHYAVAETRPIEQLLQLDHITELYRGDGLAKFRV